MKRRSLDDAVLRELAARHGTPLYVYDADVLEARWRELSQVRDAGRGFDVVRYAQKANPNLSILRLLRQLGARVDAVSAGELQRALVAGFDPREVLFCSDVFDDAALALVRSQPFQVNLGSPDMLEQYSALQPPRRDVFVRVNPGFGHGHSAKVVTGGAASKHGVWHEQLPALASRARALGIRIVGLHVHIGSGADAEHLARAASALATAAECVGPELHTLSAGGGLPIPYRAEEARVDVPAVLAAWNRTRVGLERRLGRTLTLELEPGRYLVGESGVLLTRVCGRKRNGEFDYVLVDAGFHNLVRPAMYGAYHELSIVGAERRPLQPQVLAGPLCESGDVFTLAPDGTPTARTFPLAELGDLVCIHDTGAYGSAMASNYNSQLLAAEILVHNGMPRLVRARQSIDALLDPELKTFE